MARGLRRRGRPLGDGIDDSDVLVATARKIVAAIAEGKGLLPTTAMKQAGCKSDRTTLRRLQRKWQMRSSTYLSAAQAERMPKSSPRKAHVGAPAIAIRKRATSALDRAYADLGMYGFSTMQRRPETRIERDLRIASKKMNDLVMGRASEEQIMRDAGCSTIANAVREATLGINRTMREAMGLRTANTALREAYEGLSSVTIRRALGMA
jgi:hypothetical protein